MRIVPTYRVCDRIINDSILNFEAILNRNGIDSTGRCIVCCFNLITAFTDLSFRNAILGVMTQLN